eukprot:jgi/Ulvmu1/6439/UM003_0068.1
MNLNVDDSTDSYQAITSTSVSQGKLQASDSRPQCRPRGTVAPLLSVPVALTAFVSSMVYISFTCNHDDLAMLYKYAEVDRGGKRACLPSGIQGLLYASGNAQALPALVLVAAWILAIHPLRAFTLASDRRLHACRTFAAMLPCAALVTLQPLVVVSWPAFGGDMKSWEIEGRLHDRETHTQSEAQSDAILEGGYECYASELLIWGSRKTWWAQ